MLALTILGNNSAIPAFDRNPTAQVLQIHDEGYLIDCGEGTQSQMAKYKIRRSKINHIFISHLHGDHYFGLIGLFFDNANGTAIPKIKIKEGKIRSAGVRPSQEACFMNQGALSPLQSTKVIPIIVNPLNKSREFNLEFFLL